MSSAIKSVKVTFKQDEAWISDFIHSKSSPAAYLKDLAIADYKGIKAQNAQEIQGTQMTNSNMYSFLD